ncbi:sugar kinase [Agriterribacter sp.]|uniref:sugar kinase n=1 Tax=Agriterribacter sp. TaxID=2821509 RepID=UPI002C755F34|nr:sugar kinase [Agriterribacter sp.]HRP54640.1 sugar kinase [Agriterribacter sp.]
MNKKIALFGEYLLRLTPPQQQKLVQSQSLEMHWAGSEANIAVSLSIFGSPALYITALPDNELTRAGLSRLHQYAVQTQTVKTEGTRVGTYYYERGQGARPGRVIYDREYSAFSYLKPGQINWNDIFDAAGWFHWSGITPALNQGLADVCREALQLAQQKKMVISADFNYRNTLWKYGKHCSGVMPGLLQFCDVVLADVDTAKRYFGIEPDPANLVESSFALLKKALPNVKHIAMTMRKQESANSNQYIGHLWHEGRIYTSQSYHIQQIAERIGAGDAFMAGLIHALKTGCSLEETIEFATACGVIKHSITGDFNIATRQEIDTVIQQSGSGRIIR